MLPSGVLEVDMSEEDKIETFEQAVGVLEEQMEGFFGGYGARPEQVGEASARILDHPLAVVVTASTRVRLPGGEVRDLKRRREINQATIVKVGAISKSEGGALALYLQAAILVERQWVQRLIRSKGQWWVEVPTSGRPLFVAGEGEDFRVEREYTCYASLTIYEL